MPPVSNTWDGLRDRDSLIRQEKREISAWISCSPITSGTRQPPVPTPDRSQPQEAANLLHPGFSSGS